MFSKASSSSISLAIVTPSFVISGAPKDLSRTTLRPFGPIVTLTVFANLSTPAPSAARASDPYLISFAIILKPLSYIFLNDACIIHLSDFYCADTSQFFRTPILCYSTTARISFCLTIMYSSPSRFTSVPAYLE